MTTTLRLKTPTVEVEYAGEAEFLAEQAPQVLETLARSAAAAGLHDLAATIGPLVASLPLDLEMLDATQERQSALQAELLAAVDRAVTAITGVINGLIDAGAGGSPGQRQLLDATRQMQETQLSFNLQYLQLQSQMQHENRSYTAISKIMKTKHDTVKNSISNIR